MHASDNSATPIKAVIPAAGIATRFLPATKAVPKELFPVIDKPVLQHIVEEAVSAGIHDVLLVTGRGKTSMVDHFDRRPDLEQRLIDRGDTERLSAIMEPSDMAEIYTCRQAEPLGLGHAVSYAESHAAGEPFVVMLADEFTDPGDRLLSRMIEAQARTGGIVLALLEVPREQVNRYGVAAIEGDVNDALVKVTGLVEKPEVDDAPSNLILIGRYVLPSAIFDAIRSTKPGRGGEIQLTDAMERLLEEGMPVHGIVFRGARYDTGAPEGYLRTMIELAWQRDDLGPFKEWLTDFVARGPEG
ncbi:MAG TPA: UTP--glucose-1-phosphate uridylyltransferase [Stackebrandtia sp.]|jgi:UTP--glucose-1-phosphate uridylyltransferase|uniref:UTP--glucose-1-phosphate uridylyltransferase n=1 Tax=Stackebrandtia sp. TaxID=2023065 RepID=UPI002D74ABD2|nr:UTP--glucose-1-phosphate uridylyltransferase [Stackebrandtia sp.]HZE41098.1 UTP--glucose-1-phosphate uridylyltransferase [Stackebrandtia sp.]